ncbi:hypothetical protein [Bradyrhizobium lablabi]|uniref:hypothetical protein n=1 Tax=Bradyrhizobium lablabi TaxID=722472 RepID=UPI001BAE5568|nr:hypothetical protein [Bradyrhizobium lablabi]MBR0696669.1 hypothetical protein [Bradyrhizobium lablabi]
MPAVDIIQEPSAVISRGEIDGNSRRLGGPARIIRGEINRKSYALVAQLRVQASHHPDHSCQTSVQVFVSPNKQES